MPVLAALVAAVPGYGQTLVSQSTSGFTAAQTTTITATTGNQTGTIDDFRPTTYATGLMNDVNAAGTLTNDSGVSRTNYWIGDGGGSVINAGVTTSIQLGSTTYTAGAGNTYQRAGFFIDSGNFDSPGSAATASNAGVSFRIIGNDPPDVGYLFVGIDLVKVGDIAGVYTGTGASLGRATVDFFIALKIEQANSTSSVARSSGQVFVVGTKSGSANDSTSTIGFNATTSTWQQLGPTIPSGGNFSAIGPIGDSTYTTDGQTETAFIKNPINNGTSTKREDSAEYSFGGLYSSINAALKTIYGNATSIQWDQGDLVRFVPFSYVGNVDGSGVFDFMGINSSQGGTGTLPFASNGTAAITNAYATDVNFELELRSIDGFNFGVVPEPATWISTGVMVTFGLGLLYWRRRRQLG